MHIKFINRGTGSAKSVEEYLLQEHDHKGEVRSDIQVLRGNPSQVTAVADSLEFKHKYRSAVIAWHKDDNPTDEQIAQVLDDFEKVAFAGLDPSQYCYYAVLHEESDGSKHIHIIIPRVELTTGLSFNVAPPNWQKTYDVLRDMHNAKNNWASPADISRRALSNTRKIDHIIEREGKKEKPKPIYTHAMAKKMICKEIDDLIDAEVIQDEADVIKHLNSIQGVAVKPRRSKKALSVVMDGIKKPIRLEGLAYERDFNIREVRKEFEREARVRASSTNKDRDKEVERIIGVFESIIADRAKFNQGRYTKRAKKNIRNNDIQRKKSTYNDIEYSKRNSQPNEELYDRNAEEFRENKGRGKEQEEPYTAWGDTVSSLDGSSSLLDEKISIGVYENDRDRAEVVKRIEDTKRDVQRGIAERNAFLQQKLDEINTRIRADIEEARASDRDAEGNAEEIRGGIQRHRDIYQRGTDAELERQSRTLDDKVGQVARRAREVRYAVERYVAKVIDRAKELSESISNEVSNFLRM